jgi:predicted alpha/beta-fold hydrolase
MIGHVFGRVPRLGPHDVETLSLADGDKILLHVNGPRPRAEQPATPAPIVALLHGLGGSCESDYILRITHKLNGLGYTVVRFNHRGCAPGGERLARRIYHAARTDDIEALVAYAGQRWAGRPLLLVAFSLSANMLLRYLGAYDTSSVAAAMAVCPPVDLEQCSLALARKDNWHLDRYYTRRLVQTAAHRERLFPDEPPAAFPERMSLRLFDELYTAPRGGFESRLHYYEAASAKHVVAHIQTPTVVVAAADDPIIPEDSFAGVTFSPAVTVQMERTGGHMGFVGRHRTRFGDLRWMDERVVDWVQTGT